MTPETPGNSRGRATRQLLLAAGWEVLDRLRIEQVFEALPTRELAAAAGSTERAVRHHFPDGAAFAEALLELPVPAGFFAQGTDYRWVPALTEALRDLSPEEFVAAVRHAAEANWRDVTDADEVVAMRRQLRLVSRLDAHPELRDRLRDEYYGRYLPVVAESYRAAIEACGRSLLAPFTFEQLTATLNALVEGLLLQWMVDPERITATFVADVLVAVALSLTCDPDGPQRSVSELERAASPPARRIDAAAADWAVLAHEVVATNPTPTWHEIAVACGATSDEVRRAFPHARDVAALAFAVHLDALRLAAGLDGGPPDDAHHRGRSLLNVVCELVRAGRVDRICASALIDRRRAPTDPAVHLAVPVDVVVARAGGIDVRIARRVVDVALALALSDPGTQPAELAEAACAAGGIDLSSMVSSLD